jgi:hypothetical protein
MIIRSIHVHVLFYYRNENINKKLKNEIKSLPVGLRKFSHVRGNQQSIFHGLKNVQTLFILFKTQFRNLRMFKTFSEFLARKLVYS